MKKKFIALCFLFSLSSTYCQLCSEKSTLNADEDGGICGGLEVSGPGKMCDYDKSKNGCVEIGCADLDVDDCQRMGSYQDESLNLVQCIPNTDKSRCELATCQGLVSNCERFPSGIPEEKCVLNSEKNQCEIHKCTD